MTSPYTPSAPRLPGVVRRWFAEHPKLVDRIIAFTYVGASLLLFFAEFAFLAWFADPDPTPKFWIVFGLDVLGMGVTWWFLLKRRTIPVIGFTVVSLVSIPAQTDGFQGLADSIALLYLLYAAAVFGSAKRGWIAYAIGGVLTWVQLMVQETTLNFRTLAPLWLSVMVLCLIVLLIAINLGNRRRYIQALVERADYLERDRDQLARIAVAEERERIAREMHDIVAHSLSVMIALSEGSSRAVHTAPDKASDAMQRSAETGRTALSEMRRLLGVLKGDVAEAELEMAPQPGLANLQPLIEDFRQAGLTIRLNTQGSPPDDSGFGLAVYRIVQESLTNALRYAGIGATVDLSLQYGPPQTVITVRDYGRISTATRTMDNLGTGNGLKGLAERTRMFGGNLTAGAHPEGGWIVQATLPMNGTL